jgi:thioredoxin-like negative regulator of GroEL
MLARKIEERATLDIDVYDVEYKKNKVTAKMFDVHSIPTVIFFEDSIPISRITGSEEVDDFLDVVEIIVVNGVQIID